jgi:flagellar assembly protein FliH
VKLQKLIGRVRVAAPITHELPRLQAGVDPGEERGTFPERDSTASPMPGARLLEAEFAKGFAKGKEQGREEGRREMESQLLSEQSRFEGLARSLQEQINALGERLEREAFHFALAVAAKLVKREVSVDDQVVVRQVHDAIHRVVGVETIKLRVNPADEAMVRNHRSSFLASSDSVREMAIEADEKIEQGGCILESSSGNVDARRATQLKQIEAALFPTAKEIA